MEHEASFDGEGEAAMEKSASLVLPSMGKRCKPGKGAEK
jgi:hypothetical protein